MRDLDRVREQEHWALTTTQAYLALSAVVLSLGGLFSLGYYFGQKSATVPMADGAPLIDPDVRNETVALLLARALEQEAHAEEDAPEVDLKFQEILPDRTGMVGEAPLSAPKVPEPPASDSPLAGGEKPSDTAASPPSTPEKSASTTIAMISPSIEPAVRAITPAVIPVPQHAPAKSQDQIPSSQKVEPEHPDSIREQVTKAEHPAAKLTSAVLAKPPPVSPPVPATAKPVTLAAVKAAAPKPADAAAKAPSVAKPDGTKRYAVQVSSFKEQDIADKLVRQLNAQGFRAYRVQAQVRGETWHRVRVGAYDVKEQAEQEMGKLRAARSDLDPMIAYDPQ